MYMHPIHPKPVLGTAFAAGAIRQRNHVCILLCTFNGARHLQEQLDSFLSQDHDDWSLWVSDDHSSDGTRRILLDFILAHPGREVHLFDGVGRGHAANYLSLLCRPELPEDCFVALSDQDDVWLPNRLSRALTRIQSDASTPPFTPVLYAGRTQLVNPCLTPIGRSRLPRRRLSFHNALVQNVMAGNTIMLNPSALNLVRFVGRLPDVPHHDWWLYLLISGVGGTLTFDDQPTVLYRQHTSNTLGSHRGLRARLVRIKAVIAGDFGFEIARNVKALQNFRPLLTPTNQRSLSAMRNRHGATGFAALRDLIVARVHRQTRLQSLFITIVAMFGRL